jgi:Flp pilus assembly protein TadD
MTETDRFEAYDAFMRGSELLEGRNYHQAVVALERARRLEPDKGSIRETLGRAYLSCCRYEDARAEFAVAVDLAPTDGFAHYGLARCLDRLGQRRLAGVHYKLAQCFGNELPEQ